MTQLQQKVTVPDSVMQKLDGVRGRTLGVRIVTAVVGAVGVLLAAMAVAMLVDWLAVLFDSRWRLVLTYSSLAAAVLTFAVWLVTAWRQSQQIARTASDVDQEIPQLEERWSTIAQLSTSPHANNLHPAMVRKVAQEAADWSPRVEPKQVVSLENLIRALWCLMAVTVVLGIAVVLDSRQTAVLFRRFWAPSTSISATELVDTTGNVVVARGEPVELIAQVDGIRVKKAQLYLEPSKGDPQTLTLTPKGKEANRLGHRIRSVDSEFRYRLRAGDGQTPWYQVAVADRPKIEAIKLSIIPPAYTGLESKHFGKLPRKVSALKGSQFQLAIKPKSELKQLELKLGGERAEALQVDSEGWYHWETILEENFSLSPILTEEHDLTNLRPPVCEIESREDAPPVVRILKPDEEIAVLPNDTIPISFSAKDDVGIGSAELQVFNEKLAIDGNPLPLATIPIPLGDQKGGTDIVGSVELDLSQFELENGSQLSFAVRVSEDRSALAKEEIADATSSSSNQNSGITQTPEEQPSENSTAAAASSTELQQETEASVATTDSSEVSPSQQDTAEVATSAPAADASDTETSVASTDNQPASTGTTASAEQPNSDTDSQTIEIADSTSSQSDQASTSQTNTQPKSASDTEAIAGQNSQNNPSTSNDSEEALASTTSDNETPQTVEDSNAATPAESASQQTASSTSQQPSDNQSSTSMASKLQRGHLEVPGVQSASSDRMQLTVDETVASLEGQARIELEIAIAPYLEEIDVALGKAEQLSKSVLDDLEANTTWQTKHGRDIGNAEAQVAAALNSVDELQNRTRNTLYSFIGLQLVDISQAHIYPARQDFWKSLQIKGEGQTTAVSNGWQHTTRARKLLERLTTQFENARRDYALADTTEKIKKMYEIYVEKSMALMRESGGDSSPYSRKMAEFDLDEEYLARLKEVLELRNEMRAELARILADDPRLLRRFLDAQRNRTKVLRNELADLRDRQEAANRKVKAWQVVEEEKRPELAAILLQRHVRGIEEIALSAADLHDRFETWLPLNRDVEDQELQATGELLQQLATSTQEVSATAGAYAGSKTGISPTVKTEESEATDEKEADQGELAEDTSEPELEEDQDLNNLVADAEQLYDQLNRLEVLLGQLGMREGQTEIVGFAANRLVETKRLIEQTSAWIRQLQYHQSNELHRAMEIEQYQLAMATDSLAGKFDNLEQNLSATLQLEDGNLPEPIADRARAMLAALDEQAAPNQLAAVYGLRRNQMPRAIARQKASAEGLELAEKEYDEMIRLVIEELDKFPVQDPIASLLNDPTLDELLAELEQELAINEVLGIPRRPSNLRIMDDWIANGNGGGVMGYNANRLLMNKLREQQEKRQRAIQKAYKEALARAMKESEAEGVVVDPAKPARAVVDWNSLASRLGDDLQQGRNTAPPERYRQAIEQYFRQISGASEQQSSAK